MKDRNFNCWKKQFYLFLDQDGIWRCISNAAIPFSTKHPILFHKDCQLTKLYARTAHERVLHNGVKETLTEIRSRFWIVKGRTFVKQLIHQCGLCRSEGLPYRTPPPPPCPLSVLKRNYHLPLQELTLLGHSMSEAMMALRGRYGSVCIPVV